jgi:hypothetical protein
MKPGILYRGANHEYPFAYVEDPPGILRYEHEEAEYQRELEAARKSAKDIINPAMIPNIRIHECAVWIFKENAPTFKIEPGTIFPLAEGLVAREEGGKVRINVQVPIVQTHDLTDDELIECVISKHAIVISPEFREMCARMKKKSK